MKSVIVGGTRGIGLALARHWHGAGHDLAVVARRRPEPPAELAGAAYHGLDLADPASLERRVQEVAEASGRINHLVFFQRARGDGDTWDRELAVSLTATKVFIETFVARGCFGAAEPRSIVVVASAASRAIASEQPAGYHVAKAALAQLVRYYAVQLGAAGIRVNAVSSSAVVKDENRAFYDAHPELTGLYRDVCPLGRMATAQDVVDAVEFLASDKAGFITGHELFVDGGLSLRWQESLARQVKGLA
jgi:NAD(P)-dependent dehydrogenase (short-subunit alcohol dehydrogenase family)